MSLASAEPRAVFQEEAATAKKLEETLTRSLKVGMTCEDVTKILQKQRPGWGWSDGTERKDLGAGTYLIMKFTHGKEGANTQANETLLSIRSIHFSDLTKDIPEDLVDLIRLIHLSPSIIGTTYNPVPLIRAVNALQRVGKEKALRALNAYLTLSSPEDWHRGQLYDLDEQRIFLIILILFEKNDGQLRTAGMRLGAPDLMPSEDDAHWPLFPLTLSDGVPFLMINGYLLGGVAESPKGYLDYCEKHGLLRSHLLTPVGSPIQAAENIVQSGPWKNLLKQNNVRQTDVFDDQIRMEAIRCIEPLLRGKDEWKDSLPPSAFRSTPSAAESCQRLLKTLKVQWDPETGSFCEK